MTDESIIQRAFCLAASGSCRTVAELEKALKREGFAQVSDHLCGPSLRIQLKKLMSQAGTLGQSSDLPARAAAGAAAKEAP
jgi:hypothetical protein